MPYVHLIIVDVLGNQLTSKDIQVDNKAVTGNVLVVLFDAHPRVSFSAELKKLKFTCRLVCNFKDANALLLAGIYFDFIFQRPLKGNNVDQTFHLLGKDAC